jgi:hypothetical protein
MMLSFEAHFTAVSQPFYRPDYRRASIFYPFSLTLTTFGQMLCIGRLFLLKNLISKYLESNLTLKYLKNEKEQASRSNLESFLFSYKELKEPTNQNAYIKLKNNCHKRAITA